MLFFSFFLFLFIVLVSFMSNVLYLWAMLEVVFFVVVLMFIVSGYSMVNMYGMIYYLFVQATGALIFLGGVLYELVNYGNYYLLNMSWGAVSYWLCLFSLMLKVSLFPFYYQVVMIISLFNYTQLLIFLVVPKMIPYMFMYDMMGHGDMNSFVLLVAGFTLVVASVYSLLSVDFREILGWSGLSQMGWMLIGVKGSLFFFFLFFFLYFIVLYMICEMFDHMGYSFFFGHSFLSFTESKGVLLLVVMLAASGIAPLFFFYSKVMFMFVYWGAGLWLMFFLLLVTLSVLFFYIRMIQSIGALSGAYSGYYTYGYELYGYKYVFFILCLVLIGIWFVL